MGYLICHHFGSLPCSYVGIPTAVVSDLTLNTVSYTHLEDLRQRLYELIDIGKQILSKLAEL